MQHVSGEQRKETFAWVPPDYHNTHEMAVVKSTFVESKTSPSPGLVKTESKEVRVQMRQSRQRQKKKNPLQDHVHNY
ncbi:hypothetical protein DPX16_17564 [Anabarilius grahami]|uniref:Uncharacterized protein n=1 Tax=Anabarilius grahami TaxID=495550 RepID=A0A3N0XZN8_ANAGA|nr:hypothetical protein DPX16_17564 [Anabarilius grahami]